MTLSPWPFYDHDEIQAVSDVLSSGKVNFWTGSLVRDFESAFSSYLSVPYCLATSNGTTALALA